MPFLHRELRYIFHDGKVVGTHAAEQILKSVAHGVNFNEHIEIPVELY
jgi:hypothetical protein